MQYRYELVQYFIDTFKYKNYLEIGYRRGDTFKKIKCKNKWSVDPFPHPDTQVHEATFRMTSDDFFEKISTRKIQDFESWYSPSTSIDNKPEIFDIIFIDGAHDKESVRKDILNSLDCLKKFGTIVCHDVCPLEQRLLAPGACNNAWEAFAEIRAERPDLLFYSIPVNSCGFIQKNNITKSFKKYSHTSGYMKSRLNNFKWEFLNRNREELLNYIDLETFYKTFNKNNRRQNA